MMRTQKCIRYAIAAAFVVSNAASTAQAQIAKFTNINDAVPSKFFDAARSASDPSNPNRLIIGFNSGYDPLTYSGNDFRVSLLSFSNRSATDTISFTVEAPDGFYVAKITYTQRGSGSIFRTSVSGGGATWVVNGRTALLGIFSNNPNLTGTADLTDLQLTSVPVSITDSLFSATGAMAITSADVVVTLLPLVQ